MEEEIRALQESGGDSNRKNVITVIEGLKSAKAYSLQVMCQLRNNTFNDFTIKASGKASLLLANEVLQNIASWITVKDMEVKRGNGPNDK